MNWLFGDIRKLLGYDLTIIGTLMAYHNYIVNSAVLLVGHLLSNVDYFICDRMSI